MKAAARAADAAGSGTLLVRLDEVGPGTVIVPPGRLGQQVQQLAPVGRILQIERDALLPRLEVGRVEAPLRVP